MILFTLVSVKLNGKIVFILIVNFIYRLQSELEEARRQAQEEMQAEVEKVKKEALEEQRADFEDKLAEYEKLLVKILSYSYRMP